MLALDQLKLLDEASLRHYLKVKGVDVEFKVVMNKLRLEFTFGLEAHTEPLDELHCLQAASAVISVSLIFT